MYSFKYKRRFLWKVVKSVKGHNLVPELDRMDVFLSDGSLLSIPKWSSCYLRLGPDFFLHQKEQLEKQTGQPIQVTKE